MRFLPTAHPLFVAFLVSLSLLLLFADTPSTDLSQDEPTGGYSRLSDQVRAVQPSKLTARPHRQSNYCDSAGGSTEYESISGVSLSPNPDGTQRLTVVVYVANPTNCRPGEPCPQYDDSPEYVNGWIDWDGDQQWEESEKVLDAELTGYANINYRGAMIAVEQFTLPRPATVTDGALWMRVNLGWKHDPNDPCESNWEFGHVFNQAVHLAEPVIESVRASGISTPNQVPETGRLVRLEADINVPPDYQIESCIWTGEIPSGIGDPTNQCRYEYRPQPGHGPSIETYGHKRVTLTISYRHVSTGRVGQSTKFHLYSVYFARDGDDDGNGIPNWFEYWRDDGAVPGLAAPDIIYDSTCPDNTICYGSWNPATDKISIKDGVVRSGFQLDIPAVAGRCPGGNFVNEAGIDEVANTIAHERRHEEIYHNWEAGGVWAGMDDSDDPTHPTKHDLPADDLPDNYEAMVGTDPNRIDSCDLGIHKSPTYFQYGDEEWDAIRAGDGARGEKLWDWSNPRGNRFTAQTEEYVPPPRGPATANGPASPAAPYGSLYRISRGGVPSGQLTGTYTDSGLDTNGDNRFDHLKLTAGVDVTWESDYHVVAWLADGSGTDIAWAATGVELEPGVHTVDLLFDGPLLHRSGVNGPYSISRVELREGDHGWVVDFAENVITTAAYTSDTFAPYAASFSDTYSEESIDSDDDGYMDELRVEVGVHVEKAGTYTVKGSLERVRHLASAQTSVTLQPGDHNVPLSFSGASIFQKRVDGAYHLSTLTLHDSEDGVLDRRQNAFDTPFHRFDEFEHGDVYFLYNYSDEAIDTDEDGDFDYLRLVVPLSGLQQSPPVRILATLADADGAVIYRWDELITPPVYRPNVILDVAGSVIRSHGVDGSYYLTSISLLDGVSGEVLDQMYNVHVTRSYVSADFAVEPLRLVEAFTDSGEDVDGNGKYDTLNFGVTIHSAAAGVVVVKAMLGDSSGNPIQWVETRTEMSAGITQTLTLRFSGVRINQNRVDGPYALRNLLIYSTADPRQELFRSNPYQSASYAHTDFEGVQILNLPLIVFGEGAQK